MGIEAGQQLLHYRASRMPIVLALLLAPAALGAAGPFGPSPSDPANYIIEKTKQYPIVLPGEAHWIRHDAMLVSEIVPRLAEHRIVLGIETLRAGEQAVVDRLLSEPEWDEAAAMRLMRSAAWPYPEYLDILREAWKANRATAGSMRVVALGPDPDWRETLLRAKGVSYEAFMADLVATARSLRAATSSSTAASTMPLRATISLSSTSRATPRPSSTARGTSCEGASASECSSSRCTARFGAGKNRGPTACP